MVFLKKRLIIGICDVISLTVTILIIIFILLPNILEEFAYSCLIEGIV